VGETAVTAVTIRPVADTSWSPRHQGVSQLSPSELRLSSRREPSSHIAKNHATREENGNGPPPLGWGRPSRRRTGAASGTGVIWVPSAHLRWGSDARNRAWKTHVTAQTFESTLVRSRVERRTKPGHPERAPILPVGLQPVRPPVRRIVVSPEASAVGARLDEHHPPETNGRMAVCRRCGTQTDDPKGHQHVPDERQVLRSSRWLDAELHMSHIAEARFLRAR
jgi:hypothetical protein